MKALYGLVLVLMIFVSACAQQQEPPAQPAAASNPAPAQEPEPEDDIDGTGAAVAPQMEKEQAPETKSNEARLLGAGKYDPLEVRISKGGTVTFFNDGKIKTVITIKGKGKVINTPVVEVGDKYEQEFMEAGTYEYWGVSYGPGGAKIIVE